MRYTIAKFLVFVLALLLTRLPLNAQASSACPALTSAAVWWRVADDAPHKLRAEPALTAPTAGLIPAGDIFRLPDVAPTCADGYLWLSVNYAGTLAWTAAAQLPDAQLWYAPLDGQVNESPVASDPEGCLRPPDDYHRIQLDYATLNLRTLAMLDHAQELYTAAGGVLRLRDNVMQGSYNPGGVSASFGTHDGGGALDLSVRRREDYQILWDDIPLLIQSLRVSGFAAWLRDAGSLYPGSPIHIHAIAIGDAELSPIAGEQITGTFGYWHGYNGLPQADGIPQADSHGGKVVCTWMNEAVFPQK